MRGLLRWASGRQGAPRLSIFVFHRVHATKDPLFPTELDVGQFDRVLQWIGDWFDVLPLSVAVTRLKAGTLHRGVAAITFDDGYADNLHHAGPVLGRHRMPATLFVATGYLDGGRMWNDSVIESVRRAEAGVMDLAQAGLGRFELGDAASRSAAIEVLIARVKHLPPQERCAAVDAVVHAATRPLPDDLMLTTGQLQQWVAAGHDVGAHTVSHPILASLPPDDAIREIVEGRDALQAICGRPVTLFAYPNGKPGQDYGAEHVRMVQRAGFDAAVSTAWGHATGASDPFQLPRFTPWDRDRVRFGLRLLRNLYGGTGPRRVAAT